MATGTADIIVVGGGVIGLSAAFRLAGRGHRVVLLERGHCGSGATGKALGALMPHAPTSVTPLTDIQLDSLRDVPDFVAEVGRESGLACGYRRTGRLEILNSEAAATRAEERIAAAATRWAGLGEIPLRRIDHETAQSLVPCVAYSEYGYLHDDVTARVDPARLVAGLARACRRRGVRIFEGTTARALDARAGGIAVSTDAGAFAGSHAVISSGIDLPALVGSDVAVPVHPVKGQAMALPVRGSADWPIVYGGGAFGLFHDSSIHVGSTTETKAPVEATVTPEGFADLRGRCRKLLDLPELNVVPHVWSGFRPATDDRQPIVGLHPRSSRVVLAGGHFKIGLGLAPATADYIGELIERGDESPAWATLSPARFVGVARTG